MRSTEDTGFSLIELIVVVLIIGTIAAIAIPVFLNTQDNARQAAVEASAANAVSAVQQEVLRGGVSFDDVLDGFADEDIELSLLSENFTAGDPDSVCVQASFIGAENAAVSGANCGTSAGNDDGDDNDASNGGTMRFEAASTTSFTLGGTSDDLTLNGEPIGDGRHEVGPGEHVLEGSFSRFSGANSDIVHVHEWGETGTTDLSVAFQDGSIETIADIPSTTENTRAMVKNAESFNDDVSDWDVSNVTDMREMFRGTSSFNNGEEPGESNNPIDWGDSTSNVTQMNHMFYYATVFNQDIGDWDVSGIDNTTHMLSSAYVFNQDISGWDVSNVHTMNWMFRDSADFNQDLCQWDVSNVEEYTSFGRSSGLIAAHMPRFEDPESSCPRT